MARGGYRVGSGGRKKGEARPSDIIVQPSEIPIELQPGQKTPLEYMLAVMNDSGAEESRRDRMAVSAAPFMHPRASEIGKKETKAGAAEKVARSGLFAPSEPPKVVSVFTQH